MYVFATSTCVLGFRGGKVQLHLGDPWPADDPFVKANPTMFASDPPAAVVRRSGGVEQATAAPGERRAR